LADCPKSLPLDCKSWNLHKYGVLLFTGMDIITDWNRAESFPSDGRKEKSTKSVPSLFVHKTVQAGSNFPTFSIKHFVSWRWMQLVRPKR